jgi:uroporphyrinogen-III synthase
VIPHPVAPLKGVAVLVTRPAAQSQDLCARIQSQGGEAIAFPTIAIEPVATSPAQRKYDWLIFVSANAVRHGLPLIDRDAGARIAAIGKATAAALAACEVRVDAMPSGNATSETLLAHPAFSNINQQSVLIVKGVGGRELLHDALTQRGAQVTTLEVYKRVPPPVDAARVQALEQRWRDDGVDIVTLTSVETLDNLLLTLSESGRDLLKATPFVAVSERIADAARGKGLIGACVLSRGADDDALIGAIAAWHARAR